MEAALLSAAVLACPVGMGLMMWFMAKGMRKDAPATPAPAVTQPPVNPSVEQLREEHQRLGDEIERLDNHALAAQIARRDLLAGEPSTRS